jgi:glycosyltransferase involved in cell wall biosynthesis
MSLSVALAVFNEEENLGRCLESVKEIADEIIVVDGSSSDRSVEIAKSFGAKVIITDNPPMFHINKMKAVREARGDWILQLDADEEVGKDLAEEIGKVINMDEGEIERYQETVPKIALFRRHQNLINERDGKVGDDELPYAAFFLPRANYFLGRFLMHGGVYPDGVIRLFRKGKAYLPCKDVHEQYVVEGRVGWLGNDLHHYDSPTFGKYIRRNNIYTGLMASQYKAQKVGKNPFTALNYILVKPIWWFLLTFIRHKGFLDSWQGFVFSFFSALRFAVAYFKYLLI